MAPKMTQVYAAADGYVARIETHSLAGRYIEIAHVGGWSTSYVHLNNDNPGTDDGDADWSSDPGAGCLRRSLGRGRPAVAWVGDSGNAEGTGSHTHFELSIDGTPIDPYPYPGGGVGAG